MDTKGLLGRHSFKWIIEIDPLDLGIAKTEPVQNRSSIHKIKLSPHAIDRASQRVWKVWRRTRDGNEGLHTWLASNARIAYGKGLDVKNRACHNGCRFVYHDGKWPVVITVHRWKQEPEVKDAV